MTSRTLRISHTDGRAARRRAAALPVITAGLMAVLGGCGDSPTAPQLTAADLVGAYTLVSIGDAVVPTPLGPGSTYVMVSTVITFNPQGAYTLVQRSRSVSDTTVNVGIGSGTWEVDPRAETVTLASSPNHGQSQTVFRVFDRGQILVSTGGAPPWRYQKQP